MALLQEAKREARQTIMSAIQTASSKLGKDLSLRVINYTQRGEDVVATMKIRSGEDSVDIDHVFANQQIPTSQAIEASITSAFSSVPVMAADGEEDDIIIPDDAEVQPEFVGQDDVTDAVDELTDAVNDIQEDLEDIQEDAPAIQTENNIEGHMIAECDKCYGIFISAMIKSDQKVDSIKGVCPLCGKESTQKFNWFISKLEYDDSTPFED